MAKRKTLTNFYPDYLTNHSPLSEHFLEYEKYRGIAEDLLSIVAEKLIETGETYRAPYIGDFRIKKFKVKSEKAVPDWKLTNEFYGEINKNLPPGKKKIITHRNKHSGGYAGRFFWNHKGARVKNKSLFKFTPTRYNKRNLAKNIKLNNTILKYFE